jgi:carboxypeptidase Taq
MSFEPFASEVATIADILSASALLAWDMRTMMPSGGTATRGEQMATLAQLARERLLSDAMARALDQALATTELLDDDSIERRSIAGVQAAIAHHRRLPEKLMHDRNLLRASAQAAWAEARSRNAFEVFAPYLAQTIELARQQAEALGYDDHPHDALLGQFEPGATWHTVSPIFDVLRRELEPLLERVRAMPPPAPLPSGIYPLAAQQVFGKTVATWFGYDFTRGRLDPTVHPFELAMSRNDVRITARYNESIPDIGIKATMHETGHGLYEQGIDPALTRTALNIDLVALSSMGGASLGVHESQSRLWENHVGRSLAFWHRAYPQLQATFPALAALTLDEFYRAFNAVRLGLIRTEADELSYDFHIMLRTELERALIDGGLSVEELPEAWNAAMRRDLGVIVDSDANGVLQDIHWSMGQFGSFCSYTVGNVLAAQMWSTVADETLTAAIAGGEFQPLRTALTEKIYRHGRRYQPDELIVRATGRPLDPAPYVDYLRAKYSGLYGLG